MLPTTLPKWSKWNCPRGVSVSDTAGSGEAEHRQDKAAKLGLLDECERVGAGKTMHDRIDATELRQIRRVGGGDDLRPVLFDDLPAIVLEHTLEAAHLLVAEGEIVG